MNTGLLKFLLVLAVAAGLSACETSVPEAQEEAVEPQPEQVLLLPAEEPEPGPTDTILRQMILADMLYEARMALENNRLMPPARNSAWEQFRAILDFDPENAQARQGIIDIGLRYVELANSAIAISQFDEATASLRRAEELAGNLPELVAARDRLWEAMSTETEYYPLDPEAVAQQSLELMTDLGDIARSINSRDARFLITARSDTEGRWIYRVMRESLGGQRLRGNIAIGSQPGIQVTVAVQD